MRFVGLRGKLESCPGEVRLLVGFADPLRGHGLFAQGDFAIPLATTEAALVASYHRGWALISEAGGCTAMLLYETVSRSPAFGFASLPDACGCLVECGDRLSAPSPVRREVPPDRSTYRRSA